MEMKADLIRILNEAISAEYGALFLLPQHVAQVRDEETKRQLKLILEMELEHAEKTAQMIYQLGAEPKADLPQLRPRSGLREILDVHLAGEKEAVDIYTRAEAKCQDPAMREVLAGMRGEEEGHLRLIERLLARL